MLPVDPTNTCDSITSTPMDISDENSNDSCGPTVTVTSAITPKYLHDGSDNHCDLLKNDTEKLTCDISLMTNCHHENSTNEDEEIAHKSEDNNNNSMDESAKDMDNKEEAGECDVDDDDEDEDDEDEETFIDTEEDLVNGDYGLAKLYLNEVEIDKQEEEETISELVNVTENDNLMKVEEAKGMRVAFGVILRLIFPLANGVVQGIKGIRDVRFLRVLRSLASSRQALTNLFAFAANTISMNLSSVQVSHRLEPILKLLKIRKPPDCIESLPDLPSPILSPSEVPSTPATLCTSTAPASPIMSPFFRQPRPSLPNFQANRKSAPFEDQLAPKCCTINILAEPPPGQPIRADVVFIHGLHGSLVNTWKQGLWENERKPVEFERPPKPPVRPPKRPIHSRTAIVYPPHRQKRARFTHPESQPKHVHYKEFNDEFDDHDHSFICGEPKDVQVCDDIEYSFPTFRLRMHDNGRQLQAEIDSLLQKDRKPDTAEENKENSESPTTERTTKKQKSAKPSPNDPNYSKCWPGDWLPIDCPGVRVIALNYTTDPHLWRPLWKKKEPRSSLTQRSKEMADLLIQHRVGYGHPIIWVGHSKGGLFIKQLIVDAWESGRPAAAPFWRSARGVFFYSVPHRGSHLASVRAPLLTRSVELIDIEKNSKYLADLHRRFTGLYHMGHLKIEVFSFVETALTLMSVLYLRIVGADSADPGFGDVCGIRLDHREICKPRGRDCILYQQLVNMINKVC